MNQDSVAQFDGSPRRRHYIGRSLRRVRSIGDLRARTHKLMPRLVLEYLEGGSGEEATLAREQQSFAEWRVMPRTLVNVAERQIHVSVLGREAPLSLIIAPTGLNGIFMHGADSALARAAARAGVPFVQSTMSNERLEEIARIPGLRHWWQLYVFGEDAIWQALVDRAEAAGCEALVLTTNAQIFGRREWDSRTRTPSKRPTCQTVSDAALHPRWLVNTLSRGAPQFVNVREFLPQDSRGFFDSAFWIREQMRRDLGWDDVAAIRRRWKRPLFLKGILNLDDVARARDSGVDGVVLSSHGGRQADWAVAPLDLLARARDIAGHRMVLHLAGGVRRGSDIVKAKALGADAVMVGRAPLYGLCAHGEEGVRRAIEILIEETINALSEYGAPDLSALSPDVLVRTDELPLEA